jgi:hypothetical protein
MHRLLVSLAALLLGLHGLIHLLGTTVYLRLGEIQGLPYKTTLLGGRWDLGEGGIRLFGALWVLPALGFLLTAAALLVGCSSWQPLLIGVTRLSLALTMLDWRVAYAGVLVNGVILGLVWLGPRLAPWVRW